MPTDTTADIPRNYTRWTAHESGALFADLVGVRDTVGADPITGVVYLKGQRQTPDHARMLGVRLVEAAALADGPRAIRATPQTDARACLGPDPQAPRVPNPTDTEA